MPCSLKTCTVGSVGPGTGRVEVRAFQVTKAEQPTLKASWSADGEAQFHKCCWQQMVAGSRQQGNLSDLEIKLVKEANKTAEYHDSDSSVEQEAKRIAQLLRNSSYPVFFTGAGISTAAGIGDFRGKDGKWTEKDKLKEHGAKGAKSYRRKPLKHMRPTYTHEAIVKLLEMGIFKYVISQNTDGLHRLSGVPADKISELHGNAFAQKCEICETRYDVSGCGGYLMNTIINFGDYLESHVLDRAEENARKADIFMCLGTTLMVSPANSLVKMGRKPNRLVICNRQVTPYDEDCAEADSAGTATGSRVFGDCDKLMAALMKELLGDEACREWEEGRETRMADYDSKRQE